jgi:hypothetical protein
MYRRFHEVVCRLADYHDNEVPYSASAVDQSHDIGNAEARRPADTPAGKKNRRQ